jgi:hypothetical protein
MHDNAALYADEDSAGEVVYWLSGMIRSEM